MARLAASLSPHFGFRNKAKNVFTAELTVVYTSREGVAAMPKVPWRLLVAFLGILVGSVYSRAQSQPCGCWQIVEVYESYCSTAKPPCESSYPVVYCGSGCTWGQCGPTGWERVAARVGDHIASTGTTSAVRIWGAQLDVERQGRTLRHIPAGALTERT